MKRNSWIICLLVMGMACNQPGKQTTVKQSTVFTPSRFASQSFTVNVTKDTSLYTAKGAIIKVPAGSIDADQTTEVQLEVKEFYSIADIVKAGLLTTSNGQPLSSGGMILIKPAASSKASIRRPIYVSIPATFLEPAMNLYEGEEKDNRPVNWTRSKNQLLPAMPGTAAADSGITPTMLKYGEELFQNACATCHGIEKDLTGPALAWSYTKFKALDPNHPDLLYRFTQNYQSVLASGNLYFNYQFERWNKTPMNVFPHLSREEMDALYAYIENRSKRRNTPIAGLTTQDSCIFNLEKAGYVGYLLEDPETGLLIKHKDDEVFLIPPLRRQVLPMASKDTPVQTNGTKAIAGNETIKTATRYNLPVYQWGWLNVDALTTDLTGATNISIDCSTEGIPENANVRVNLFIPGLRVNIEATKDAEGRFHFMQFHSVTGYKSYIMVTTDDIDNFHFGISDFTLASQQQLHVKVKPSSIEKVEKLLDKISERKRRLPEAVTNAIADTAFEEYENLIDTTPVLPYQSMVPAGYNPVTAKFSGMKDLTWYLPGKGTPVLLRNLQDTLLCPCLTKHPPAKP